MFKHKKIRFVLSILLMLSLLIPVSKVTTVHAADFATNIIAISNVSQTVYTGPGTDYVSVGSISLGERVYIIDKEPGMDWYRIVYNVNNTPAQKAGYVPTYTMDILIGNPSETDYSNGYYAYSVQDQAVYSSPTMDIVDGSISAEEGITVFYSFTPINLPNRTAYFIEYSTASGPKRGYIMESIVGSTSSSGVARVKSTADLYYGPNTSNFAVAGTVFTNEYVTVLEKENDWVYVEYNTNSGRKRGYFSQGYLHFFRPSNFYYKDIIFYHYGPVTLSIGERRNVYAGPSSSYAVIGYVENEFVKNYGFDGPGPNGHARIVYDTPSGLQKTGFLL